MAVPTIMPINLVPPIKVYQRNTRSKLLGYTDTRVSSNVQMAMSLIVWLHDADRIPSTTPGAEPPRDARVLVQLGHIQHT